MLENDGEAIRLTNARLMMNLSPLSIKFSKPGNTPQKPQYERWKSYIISSIIQQTFVGFSSKALKIKKSKIWLVNRAQTANISLSDDDSK